MSRRFDWTATFLGATFTGGLFLDGWAHTHGMVDNTFFTPWHAVLYSSFLVMALLYIGRAAWGFRRKGQWRGAMPVGYGLALVGVACWFVGGPFDAIWHSIFGFEASIEALLSPAHAPLAVGYGLMASGPLRATLARPRGCWGDELPIVLSLAFVIANLTFFTQIAHPVANLWAARGGWDATHALLELGVTGFELTAIILTAPLLFLVRWDRLPAGGVTIAVGLNVFLMGFLYDRGPYPVAIVLAIVGGAIAVDVLRAVLQPEPAHATAFRVFAVVLALLPWLAYFLGLSATHGIAWTPHVWLGTLTFTGIGGWLTSYLILPPTHAEATN